MPNQSKIDNAVLVMGTLRDDIKRLAEHEQNTFVNSGQVASLLETAERVMSVLQEEESFLKSDHWAFQLLDKKESE